ncbi:MAG: class I SAM-dependent methyltransferase [Pseudonocardiales bacterium]|nr:class I SAM-dependent methyltransferase [Pseudonocardiales bacterium]
MSGARRVEACRSCGDRRLTEILSLGWMPVANALVPFEDADRPDPVFPLGIQLCPRCALVQIIHELPAEAIFGDDYPYFSSYSDSFVRHAASHAQDLLRRRALRDDAFVVEVGSNDGYLLRPLAEAGVPVLGIDPAPGPVQAAVTAGVPSLQAFFGHEVACRVRAECGPADVVIANNVMAHVPDVNNVVAGIAELLAPDGVVTVENPWIKDLVERLEFDTIYHEHYCYLSCLAVSTLFERHGLYLNDVEYFPDLHGGSLRWWFSRSLAATDAVARALDIEHRLGVGTPDFYAGFADEVEQIGAALVDLLCALRASGRRVAGYGGAAKATTLMNAAGIDNSLVEFVVDRNAAKWGRLIPGCRVPVRPPEALLEEQPDYTLLLVWNIAREVLGQQGEYQRRGGRFIVPVGEMSRRATVLEPSTRPAQ